MIIKTTLYQVVKYLELFRIKIALNQFFGIKNCLIMHNIL